MCGVVVAVGGIRRGGEMKNKLLLCVVVLLLFRTIEYVLQRKQITTNNSVNGIHVFVGDVTVTLVVIKGVIFDGSSLANFSKEKKRSKLNLGNLKLQ